MRLYYSLFIIIYIINICLGIPPIEQEALNDLSVSLGLGWNDDDSCFRNVTRNGETMNAISCDENGVIDINLSGLNLEGTLPLSIGDFAYLNRLILNNNKIYGDIPNTLHNIGSGIAQPYPLMVHLHNNKLSGSIPPSLFLIGGTLQGGTLQLSLSSNQIEGEIPSTVGNFGTLHTEGYLSLLLNDNQLSGTIPASIVNIGNSLEEGLVALHLDNNNLTGKVPSSIYNIKFLDAIHLYNNNFDKCPSPLKLDDVFCDISNNPLPSYCNIASNCREMEEIIIKEPVTIDEDIDFTTVSVIIITTDGSGPAIINVGKNPIEIDGIELILDFSDNYDYIIDQIKNNKSFEYIIMDGEFNGNFSSISIKLPENESLCEIINPLVVIDESRNLYKVVFNIENTCTKLKWWAIVLICIGVILLLIIGFIILLIFNKSLFRKIFPFHRRSRSSKNELNNNDNDEWNKSGKTYVKKSRGKNPIYIDESVNA